MGEAPKHSSASRGSSTIGRPAVLKLVLTTTGSPDTEVTTLSGKLIVQITWYGSVRTPFTWEFCRELLDRAGFRRVVRCAFQVTASAHAAIVELDNRERESLFVEAVR